MNEKEQLKKTLNNKLEVLDDFFTNKARAESRGNASCFLNLQNQYGEELLEIKDSFLDEAILDNGIYVKLISTINELEKQYFDLNIDFEDIEELIQDSYASLSFNEKINILKPKQIEEFIEHLDDELQREVDKELFKYINQGFSKKEVEQIRLGLEAGIDVLKYADPKYSWFEMQVLRKILVNEKKKERELELNI